MKDTIYIDIEDDITAIIDKVRSSKQAIVALVPPKRAGALQSAVNLKLLQKAASSTSKQIVLITSSHALVALAAGLNIPVAKNLQSKPEVPEMEAPIAEPEDVIDGKDLPIGELAKTANKPVSKEPKSAADEISEKIEFIPQDAAEVDSGSVMSDKLNGLKNKVKNNVPNFDSFRKKFFLIGGGAVLLIALLVWALVFAPAVEVIINAKTTVVNINKTLRLQPGSNSNPGDLILRPVSESVKTSESVEFQPTGRKEVGEKASGSMTLKRTNISSQPINVPKGTTFSSGNFTFVSTSDVTLAGTTVGPGGLQQDEKTVQVVAEDIGEEYNLSARSYAASVDGFNSSGSEMSGGSSEEVTVVSKEDISKAKEQLQSPDVEAAKEELRNKFDGASVVVIEESFIEANKKETSSPAVDTKAEGKAKLTVEITYSMQALQRSEVNDILNGAMDEALEGKGDQQSYGNGENEIKFQDFRKTGSNFEVKMITTGYIGPKIDLEQLAENIKGKRYGEIEAVVNELPNVRDVDVKFSYFWVNQAPNNIDKVNIRLVVDNE